MPLVIHPRVKRNARRIAALTAVACFAGPAAAQATCPTTNSKQVFSQFGDSAWYFQAPGGSFESSAPAWTHTGTQVVPGNESFFLGLGGTSHTQSLRVPATKYAVSPSFCVGMQHPTLRLVARQISGTGGQLKVEILYPSGRTTVARLGGVVSNSGKYGSWWPSQPIDLANAMPFLSATETLNVRLRVTADVAGAWAVDSVFIDPYRAR